MPGGRGRPGVTGLRPLAGGVHVRRHRGRGGPGVAQGEAAGAAGLRLAGAGRPALRRVADAGQPDRLPGVQPQPRPAVRDVQGDPGPGGLRRGSTPQAVDDLLELQAVFATERTWCQPSPLVSPERVRAMKDRGELTPEKRAEYRAALDRLRAIEAAAPRAEIGRRERASPDRPVGARSLGGRGREAARSLNPPARRSLAASTRGADPPGP